MERTNPETDCIKSACAHNSTSNAMQMDGFNKQVETSETFEEVEPSKFVYANNALDDASDNSLAEIIRNSEEKAESRPEPSIIISNYEHGLSKTDEIHDSQITCEPTGAAKFELFADSVCYACNNELKVSHSENTIKPNPEVELIKNNHDDCCALKNSHCANARRLHTEVVSDNTHVAEECYRNIIKSLLSDPFEAHVKGDRNPIESGGNFSHTYKNDMKPFCSMGDNCRCVEEHHFNSQHTEGNDMPNATDIENTNKPTNTEVTSMAINSPATNPNHAEITAAIEAKVKDLYASAAHVKTFNVTLQDRSCSALHSSDNIDTVLQSNQTEPLLSPICQTERVAACTYDDFTLMSVVQRSLTNNNYKDGEDIELFLRAFEMMCHYRNWPECIWSHKLQPLLTDHALQVFDELAPKDRSSYKDVKEALFKLYNVTTERSRLRFRNLQMKKDETYVEFVERMSDMYTWWLESESVSTLQELKELNLKEQFLKFVPEEVRKMLLGKQITTAIEAAELAQKLTSELQSQKLTEAAYRKQLYEILGHKSSRTEAKHQFSNTRRRASSSFYDHTTNKLSFSKFRTSTSAAQDLNLKEPFMQNVPADLRTWLLHTEVPCLQKVAEMSCVSSDDKSRKVDRSSFEKKEDKLGSRDLKNVTKD